MDCKLKDGTPIEVRRAVESDLADLRLIRDLPDFVHEDRFARQESSEIEYLVAVLDGRVVAHLLILWNLDSEKPGIPDITDVLVRPGLRSRGIGQCLLRAAERMAQERGCEKVRLSVNPAENPRAMRFYERLGYVVEGLPYVDVSASWSDSTGKRHRYDLWNVDMVKKVAT